MANVEHTLWCTDVYWCSALGFSYNHYDWHSIHKKHHRVYSIHALCHIIYNTLVYKQTLKNTNENIKNCFQQRIHAEQMGSRIDRALSVTLYPIIYILHSRSDCFNTITPKHSCHIPNITDNNCRWCLFYYPKLKSKSIIISLGSLVI